MRLSSKILLTLIIMLGFGFSPVLAFAAQVAAVKGKKVLIQGKDLKPNSIYFVVSQGKRRGIVRIQQVKGSRAMGVLLRGQVEKGHNLVFRPSKGRAGRNTKTAQGRSSTRPQSSSTRKSTRPMSTSYAPSSGFYAIGGALAYQQNSASIKFNNGDSDSLSGSGIGFKAFGDYMLTENIHLRGEVGTVAFSATGADKCFGEICRMKINYLGASIGGRYMFGSSHSKMRFWAGAAGGLIFPMSTGNTNAVETKDVSSTMTFHIGGGLDYNINDKFFIPITAEYVLLPPSDQVSPSFIGVKAGLGMKL